MEKELHITYKHKLIYWELFNEWRKIKEDHLLIRYFDNKYHEDFLLSENKYDDLDIQKMIEKKELYYLYSVIKEEINTRQNVRIERTNTNSKKKISF